MTMMPIRKVCPRCHRSYYWNPTAGRKFCPYCMGTETPLGYTVEKVIDLILSRKKK
jgi:hypothetical protein